ncbi:uncharacterized protein LOC113225797 [Hyposmocoma kahamanoa]|uniref:uncharacterized protein LOC113225797 n=1 Tax=Hyposmocoma kahamanoa TaxID=1477025 RepID=UPI000E6D7755|nr:uncharacterized protein LOC113225797 [Hyposmocoma kahamanoa]
MICARINLQQRPKTTVKFGRAATPDQPRRYCQKRLVNPDHDEGPRWIGVFERFHCNGMNRQDGTPNKETRQKDADDLFLSVQNLKFLGDEQRKRSRTSFKYKTLMGHNTHRMFVKQIVEDQDLSEDGRSSQQTCYYFDDYAKYVTNTDRSRPSSGKSSIFLQGITTKFKQNKAVQVDTTKTMVSKKTPIVEQKLKNSHKPGGIHNEVTSKVTCEKDSNIDDTKIAFHKSGKRKSLTITRVPSPETVQVIRVDVVCNFSNSSTMSDYDENKKQTQTDSDKLIENKFENFNIRNNHYANKYLLMNTIKTLDENVSAGAKVTLLCKTFRLTDRGKGMSKKSANKVVHK